VSDCYYILYHGEKKLHIIEMMMMFALYHAKTLTIVKNFTETTVPQTCRYTLTHYPDTEPTRFTLTP